MKKVDKEPLFKKGIWIKEQQGYLTIGSLDEKDENVMVIPDHLGLKILEFENDMLEALYGNEKIQFNPAVVDIGKLFKNIEKKFKNHNLRISFSNAEDSAFKGDYNKIYSMIENFIFSSVTAPSPKEDAPIIYINASVLQNHLCIIYRDSSSISDPSKLKKVFEFIVKELNGEISYKSTSSSKSYYDIMIPSK